MRSPYLIASLFLATVLVAAGRGGEQTPPVLPPHDPGDLAVLVDDPTAVCRTGCSAEPNATGELTLVRFRQLAAEWSSEALDVESTALDTLLFHGADTRALLAEHGARELAPDHLALLRRELGRDRAWLSVRMVNDAGEERLSLGPIAVPIGVKQHLFPEHTRDLTPPEVSGTIHRVGVRHLWTRL